MRQVISKGTGTARAAAAALAAVIIIPALCFMNICSCIYGAELTSIENYQGVKHFNFAAKGERSETDEDCMIDPEYSIKMENTMPDEYFGAKTVTRKDTSTGESVKGLALGVVGEKNQCGGICHNMFMYKGNWIDVKTTYVDWKVGSTKTAFFAGGFTRQRWRGMYWVEMKHEFFLAGTDTPVEIKGFQNYSDIDNCQGVLLERGKIEDVWINYKDAALNYDIIPADTDYALDSGSTFRSSKEMLYVQTTTEEDIHEEGDTGYDPEEAAKYCIGFTFSGSTITTCISDSAPTGLNILESGYYKLIPSATPEQGTPLIAKKVLDDDEEESESNTVKPEEQWIYHVNAFLPEETEEYNFYESFRIEDQIDENLNIEDIRVKRLEEDVSELFTITETDNLVSATAVNVKTKDFYGYDYILEITVSLKSDRETLEEAGLMDEEYCYRVPNEATAVYGTGKEDKEIPTNETVTVVQFTKEADIIITKEISASDAYDPHGEAAFIFRLSGTTAEGEEKEYNRYVRFPREYIDNNTDREGKVRRSVTFEKIPEGEYICSEYDVMRFEIQDIKEITGGEKAGEAVSFKVDGGDSLTATFVNRKQNWNDYSHSSLVVNRVGTE